MKRISLNGYVCFQVVNPETNRLEEIKEQIFTQIDQDTVLIGDEYYDKAPVKPRSESQYNIERTKYSDRVHNLYIDTFHKFKKKKISEEKYKFISSGLDNLISRLFETLSKPMSLEEMFVGHLALNQYEKELQC